MGFGRIHLDIWRRGLSEKAGRLVKRDIKCEMGDRDRL